MLYKSCRYWKDLSNDTTHDSIYHCFILGPPHYPLPRRKCWFSEKLFQPKVLWQNTNNNILKPPTVRNLMVTEQFFFVFTPSPKRLGADLKTAGPLFVGNIMRHLKILIKQKIPIPKKLWQIFSFSKIAPQQPPLGGSSFIFELFVASIYAIFRQSLAVFGA